VVAGAACGPISQNPEWAVQAGEGVASMMPSCRTSIGRAPRTQHAGLPIRARPTSTERAPITTPADATRSRHIGTSGALIRPIGDTCVAELVVIAARESERRYRDETARFRTEARWGLMLVC
jgi:hypothetical protein